MAKVLKKKKKKKRGKLVTNLVTNQNTFQKKKVHIRFRFQQY